MASYTNFGLQPTQPRGPSRSRWSGDSCVAVFGDIFPIGVSNPPRGYNLIPAQPPRLFQHAIEVGIGTIATA